jgi:predicted enzyme related to lactoylglutathione lyase
MTILARRKEMALDFVQELTASMGVTDMDRSIAWYGEVLGYELLYRVDEIGWCEMKTEMAGVNIGLSQNQEVPQGGNATNVWSVADIEAAKAHLDVHGMKQDVDIQHVPNLGYKELPRRSLLSFSINNLNVPGEAADLL